MICSSIVRRSACFFDKDCVLGIAHGNLAVPNTDTLERAKKFVKAVYVTRLVSACVVFSITVPVS